MPAMKCSVADCPKEALKRCLCEAHYCQFRRAGTLACKPIAKKGAPAAWIEAHQDYDSDECLMWPFFKEADGYGRAKFRGRVMPAHRAMCLLVRGEPAEPSMHAAHNCGNASCVNPRHIRWATARENNLDRNRHGTMPKGERSGQTSLTNEQVLALYADPRPARHVALTFGVSEGCVYGIRCGQTWAWLTGHKRVRKGLNWRKGLKGYGHARGWPAEHGA